MSTGHSSSSKKDCKSSSSKANDYSDHAAQSSSQQSKGSIRVGSTHFATSVAPQSASDQWYVLASSYTNSINSQVCMIDQLGTNCLAVRSIMFVSCTVDSSNACGNYTAFRVQMRQVFMQ
jgi:hypothetical protein